MPKKTLHQAYIVGGKRVGPGENIELTDDQIKSLETVKAFDPPKAPAVMLTSNPESSAAGPPPPMPNRSMPAGTPPVATAAEIDAARASEQARQEAAENPDSVSAGNLVPDQETADERQRQSQEAVDAANDEDGEEDEDDTGDESSEPATSPAPSSPPVAARAPRAGRVASTRRNASPLPPPSTGGQS